jgi:hypothetical protein
MGIGMDVLLLDLNDQILYNMLSRLMGFRISTYIRLSHQLALGGEGHTVKPIHLGDLPTFMIPS